MRRLTSLLLLLAITWTVSAQCDADFDFMGAEFGISPNPLLGETFASGMVGQPYGDVIHMIVPANTAGIPDAPIELPLDSVVLDSILLINDMGEPLLTTDIGLSMYPNNNNDLPNPNAFLGGNQYCVSLEGTPEMVGVFTGAIYTTAWVTVPFLGANAIPFPFEGYTLIINDSGSSFCEDPAACNFATEESCDFTSCIEGCMDDLACNYDPAAEIESGDCLFHDAVYECGGNCIADDDDDGICDDEDSCIGSYDLCGICNGPGEIYDCGCTDIPVGDCDCSGSEEDAIGVCGGNCVEDDDNNGVCDADEVLGCTYELADNYDPMATRDDGLCEFPCSGDINQNVFDWDGDSAVTIADFLAMLSVFGDVDVDSDGVWDSSDQCTDLAACNYADEPSTPCQFLDVLGVCGGGCEADEDSDGVCDDIDDCIGVVDECGVCNGPGPTEVVIDDITIIYDSVYAENIDTWFVYELGADTTFSITCAPSFSACGDPVSYQGYDYATVLIGEQCWFAENLRSENYENGDVIPFILSNSEWQNTSSGALTAYDLSTTNLEAYGGLYNWYAVNDVRGLCPSGWHVPSDGEWTVLTDHLGGPSLAGDQMKTSYGWSSSGNGTNSSGFSALPGGSRSFSGWFNDVGNFGHWWSSSLVGSNEAWYRALIHTNDVVYRFSEDPRYGFSVRCVRSVD